MAHSGLPPALLTDALHACVVGVIISDALDGDYPIVYANPACEALTGFSQSELLGRNCRFLQGEDRDQPALDDVRQAMAHGRSVTVVLRNYRKDGALFYNELTLSPVREATGRVTHYIGFQNDVTVREEARQHAERTSALLASTLDRVTDGVTSLDRHGTMTYVNASAAEMAGKTPDELIGRRFLTVFPTAPSTPLGQVILRAGEAGTPLREVSFSTEVQKWIEVSAYPAQDGVSVLTRDVTESHQAQAALQQSEQRVLNIFAASPMPVALTRLSDRVFLEVNTAFEALTEFGRDEIIGRPSPELNLWVHDAERLAALQEMVDGNPARKRTVRLRSKSGMIRDCFVSFVPIEISGEPCVISLVQDMTEENRARQAMEQSEERYRRLATDLQRTLDMSQDLVTSFDLQGHFLTASASSAEILGYTPEELIGRQSLDLVHPDDQALTAEANESVTQGKAMAPFQNRYIRKDGAVVWLEWTAAVLDGDPTIYCVGQDITHRRLAELQIRELNQSLQHQLRQLTGLRDIDRAISSSVDFPTTLRMIMDHLVQVLEADAVTVLLLAQDGLTLEYAGTRGFSSVLLRRHERVGEGLAGQVALSRHALHLPDVQRAELHQEWRRVLRQEGLTSYYANPIMLKGRLLGVIEVLYREPFELCAEWVESLDLLVGQVAIAVENSNLFEQLERQNLALRLAYEETIEGWARALDLRDKETEGHSRRVTERTVDLCRHLGMTAEKLVDVRRGALLHDIGKMAVPDAILLKAGPLTDEEWTVMKKHPDTAAELLSPIKFLRPALDIPQYHHEKWDGTGYPRGLKGTEIPLTARAFAVVDVFDALTSDRPYRSAWTRERALEHLQAGAGTHFDPHVLEVFLTSLKPD